MNCLLHLSSHTAAIFTRTNYSIAKHSLYGCSSFSWKRKLEYPVVNSVNLEFVLTTFRVRCYSARKGRKSASPLKKLDTEPAMEQEKDAFFVVRKGDVVGVYKSWTECQAQVGSSICDPPVSVYKGHSLPKDTEEYLVSRGLKNALYTIRAEDLKEDIFDMLVPCPFQDPASSRGNTLSKDKSKKRLQEVVGPENVEGISVTSISENPLRKHVKLDHSSLPQAPLSNTRSCILEFDGSSKGNPGQAGAGAVLRADDGTLICRLREGLGVVTNNVAEYRAMILGMKYALKKGFTGIRVQGDSKLVCMQVQGLWKVKHQDMCNLYKEAKELKDKFLSFQISHVLRNLNSEADTQANLAITLADGQVQEVEE
ncbi:Ribonuclease H protein [Quillaja saponaria]|uniref:Ribonuclease H protein n=1 Tax=Quillaja saponaria TaxID=32244 RepID=A0AAD7L8R4_QUISA|nr:Ribonuclease H protein [Quillaja saponaria]